MKYPSQIAFSNLREATIEKLIANLNLNKATQDALSFNKFSISCEEDLICIFELVKKGKLHHGYVTRTISFAKKNMKIQVDMEDKEKEEEEEEEEIE